MYARTSYALVGLLVIAAMILPEHAEARRRVRRYRYKYKRHVVHHHNNVRHHSRVLVWSPWVVVNTGHPMPAANPAYLYEYEYYEEPQVRPAPPAPAPLPPAPAPQAASDDESDDLGLSLRASAMGYNDTPDDAGSLGGFGLGLQVEMTRHLDFEIGADFLASEDPEYGVARYSCPVTAGLKLSLFPDRKFNLYGVGGAGIHFREVEDTFTGVRQQFWQAALHIGLGGELQLSRWLSLGVEGRWFRLGDRSGYDDTDLGQEFDRDRDANADSLPTVMDDHNEDRNAFQLMAGAVLRF